MENQPGVVGAAMSHPNPFPPARTDPQEPKVKRSRGRPRVESGDQTAAEIRRTQVRLAQRSYRSRRENKIGLLEAKVAKLEEMMRKADKCVQGVHDLAVKCAVEAAFPLFFHELTMVANAVSISARDAAAEDEISTSRAQKAKAAAKERSSAQSNPGPASASKSTVRPVHSFSEHRRRSEFGWDIISDSEHSSDKHDKHTSSHDPHRQGNHSPTDKRNMHFSPTVAQHSDDASGTPSDSEEENDDDEMLDADTTPDAAAAQEGPRVLNLFDTIPSPPPPAPGEASRSARQRSRAPLPPHANDKLSLGARWELPLPSTPFSGETSFSRRFHRECLRAALGLIRAPRLDRHHQSDLQASTTLVRKLGLPLRFFSLAEIERRILARLAQPPHASLDSLFPYPRDVLTSNPDGDAEADALGPWIEPDELEDYLFARGIHVPPTAEFVECETDRIDGPSFKSTWTLDQHPEESLYPDFDPLFGFDYGQGSGQGSDQSASATSQKAQTSRKVMIDVQRLVKELVDRAYCRGRSPAVRRGQIVEAIECAVVPIAAVAAR